MRFPAKINESVQRITYSFGNTWICRHLVESGKNTIKTGKPVKGNRIENSSKQSCDGQRILPTRKMMKKVLIINAHQLYEGISIGRLNQAMVALIREEMMSQGCQVIHTNIEQGYDINAEVEKHLAADIIILQSPVYWFGMPWIYKKYVDEVFTAGMRQQSFLVDDGRSRSDPGRQYGTGGKMQGKKYMLSLTWNAPEASFGDPQQSLFEGKTVDDVFVSNTANYKFCGVEIVPAFSCHDVMKQPHVELDMVRLRKHLKAAFF